MGYLVDVFAKEEMNTVDPYERWNKIGLLEGIKGKQNRILLATYFEIALHTLMNDLSEITVDTIVFPMIRRLFTDDKLSVLQFVNDDDDRKYLDVVNSYVRVKREKVSKELDIRAEFKEFLITLIIDYVNWSLSPSTRKLGVLIKNADGDVEAELLALYCETCNVERLVDISKQNLRELRIIL